MYGGFTLFFISYFPSVTLSLLLLFCCYCACCSSSLSCRQISFICSFTNSLTHLCVRTHYLLHRWAQVIVSFHHFFFSSLSSRRVVFSALYLISLFPCPPLFSSSPKTRKSSRFTCSFHHYSFYHHNAEGPKREKPFPLLKPPLSTFFLCKEPFP